MGMGTLSAIYISKQEEQERHTEDYLDTLAHTGKSPTLSFRDPYMHSFGRAL